MPMQIFFLIVAAVTLISAVMVVTVRRMMHAALWLVMSLFGVALLFAHAGSQFLCRGAGAGLYRRDRHPDHFCGDADPQDDG